MIEPKVGDAVVIRTVSRDVEIVTSGWTSPDAIGERDEEPNATIGFVCKLDSEAIFLAQTTGNGGARISGVARVPRVAIVDIAQLRRYTRSDDTGVGSALLGAQGRRQPAQRTDEAPVQSAEVESLPMDGER